MNKKIIKPGKIKKDILLSGQFKLFWQSKNEFQNTDPDIYYINVIKSNNDKLYDFITLSRTGHVTVFDGENGQILFNIKTGHSESKLSIINSHIITGVTNGEIYCFSRTGKKLWVNKIIEPSKVLPYVIKSNAITNNITNRTNITNNITNITKSTTTNLIKIRKKPWRNQIAGKILDIHRNYIQTRQGFYLLNLSSGKVSKSFKHFNSELTGLLAYGKFNDDDNDDYLVCGTNFIHCLDGLTLKELWQSYIPYSFSGNKNIIFNKKKDLFIILPLYNGIIKILNKHGAAVFEIKLNENLIHQPLVFKNKYFMFLQRTLQNNLYAFDFEKRKNIWSLNMTEKIIDLRNIDLDYDNKNELFVLTEKGEIYIIHSETGKVLDFFSCLDNNIPEKVISNLAIFDIDDDNNFEFCFATDMGNIYVYKYISYNKKFTL